MLCRSIKLISRHFLLKQLHSPPSSPLAARLTKQKCVLFLQNCMSMEEVKQIQAQIFRNGIHLSTNSLNKLMAFCTNPFAGNLQYAERIFNCIEKPSLFIYNLMVKSYTKSGCFRKTLMLFNELREDGFWPDNFTYPFVLKAIGCLGDAKEALRIHGFVVKSGMEFDTYVCNSLMDMYAALGRIYESRQLFDDMPEKDLASWNIMISGFVRCKKFGDAIGIFHRMSCESNLKPDAATLVSTLSACAALKDMELGKEINDYIEEKLHFSPIIGNSLLNMYVKCGCLNIAQKIFEKMPTKNVMCWTSMISGYINCGRVDEARSLFERSPDKDIVLWTAMINGYVQFNRFDEAMELFHEIQIRRLKPDKFTMVTLLTGCAQTGALEQGKWIHEYMDENRFPVDAVVGTALIEMYAKCGCVDKSLQIFGSVKGKDAALWTSIICGLAMNGETHRALELFSAMKRSGCKPDDITFIGVLSACSHAGLVEEGWRHFNSMREIYRMQPKLEHYGCLIDLFGRAGRLDEAEELIHKIPKENTDIILPLYGSLLSSCRTHGNIEMGERIAKQLREIQSPDSSVQTLLANIYASAFRWEDVMKVRSKMKLLGIKKVPGGSSIEVDGIVHEFLASDPSHPWMKEICSLLNNMAKPVSGSEKNELENLISF